MDDAHANFSRFLRGQKLTHRLRSPDVLSLLGPQIAEFDVTAVTCYGAHLRNDAGHKLHLGLRLNVSDVGFGGLGVRSWESHVGIAPLYIGQTAQR